MKKILVIMLAIVCLSVNANSFYVIKGTTTEVSSVRTITVYLIKQVGGSAWSKSPVSAEYDSEANTIKVGRFTYSIYENQAYGQERDGRSEYKYTAGGYYFNL